MGHSSYYRFTACISAGFVVTLAGCTGSTASDSTETAKVAGHCVVDSETPGDTIFLNQHGMLPDSRKYAIVRSVSEKPLDWTLRHNQAGDEVLLTGKTDPKGMDPASGISVHTLDFSVFGTEVDNAVISVCGAESHPFDIRAQLYAPLAEDALRYFYQSRIGTPIDSQYVHRPDLVRPAALDGLTATCFSGADMQGQTWPACEYSLDVSGSWYDAGDFGVYAVNMGQAIWQLQNSHERLVRSGRLEQTKWGDGRIPSPDNGNNVGEILDEARWGVESLLKLQAPQGSVATVPVGGQVFDKDTRLELQQINVSGMVHHKLAARVWPPVPVWPHEADQERLLYPPSTSATLALAATGAQCARLWKGVDDDFARQCLDAAIAAYSAAKTHPDIYAYNNFDGSGAYGDTDLEDEFAWAAVELFITTREQSYLDEALARGAPEDNLSGYYWQEVGLLPALSFATAESLADQDIRDQAVRQVLQAAEALLTERNRQGFAIPLNENDYGWGSNGDILNRASVLGMAYDLTGEAQYLHTVIDVMDYVLGRNVLSQSYVTGYGEQPMRAPHHRFWAGAFADGYPEPPPGVVSGGPNFTNPADEVAASLAKSCAPMACWVDDHDAYALNEVAINWNAALVWVAVFLDDTSRRDPPQQP